MREDKIRALASLTAESELRTKIKANEQTILELQRKVNVFNHENSLLRTEVKNGRRKFDAVNKEKFLLQKQQRDAVARAQRSGGKGDAFDFTK